jgi:histone H3/H4
MVILNFIFQIFGGGKGDKGLGKGEVRRHRKKMRENSQETIKSAFRRLARTHPVKRISGDIYDEVEVFSDIFLKM